MAYLTSRQNEQQDQLLKLFADPFQGQIQINAFWASFGVSIGISAALAILFSLLRPRHSLVYAPKAKYADAKHAPPPVGRGPFSWIKPVAKTKEDVLVERIGLDAIIFLRFTRMLRNIFCILGIVGIAVMIPVNVTMATKSIVDKTNDFAVMTPLYVFGSGLWAQVVMAYFIDIVVIYFLWYNYRKVFHLRRAYYESPEYQKSLHARSVLIRHIPANLRNEAGILQLTDEVNPTGVLPLAITARNVRELPDLIEKHEDAVRKLESILAKYLKNPERIPARKPMMKPPKGHNIPSTDGKIDAIEFWRHRISVLEQTITDLRHNIDSRDAMPYGFAAWNQVQQAHVVAYAARKKYPQGAKIRPAPRPSDIIWQNLALSKAVLRRKSIMNFVWVTVLTILWTPLNAGLAIFVANLSNLGSVWSAFQRQLEAHKVFWSVVQGIAAPAITSLVYLVLPIIFRRLQIRAGDVTKTARELHVLRNLYLFFVLNNLVVFSLFAAIWQFVTKVVNESKSDSDVWRAIKGAQFFLTVTTQLCQAISPFWVTWILQRNLGAAIDLAQLWTLFYQWFAKVFMAPTPRQHIEWTAPQPFQYASYYNYFLFYATVSLCFATLQPIVLVCTALYFIMDAVLKKYLLMYVFVTKTESGGQFWRTLINRLLFACLLANVVIGVTVKARGTWVMVGCLVPLLFLVLGFKWYCMKTFDPGMDYYHQSGMRDTERPAENTKAISRATDKFRHPALERKLITPMVSSKAKHIVQQIYSGRMDSDFDQHGPIPFQEIPMQPMKQAGQTTTHSAPFEIVPEAQQDFQFYQNRADFREAIGDGLSKPEDLIGSRPGTPASLLPGPPRSASPYHDLPQKTSSPLASPLASPKRKEVRTSQIHPAYRNSSGLYQHVQQIDTNDEGDISLNMQHGRYTDPHDDRANLLQDVGDLREPTGEFLSMDQWRTNESAPQSRGDDMGGYDYFKGYRKS